MTQQKVLQWLANDLPCLESSWLAAFIASTEDRHGKAMCQLPQLTVKAGESPIRQFIREMLQPKAEVTKDGIATIPFSGPIAHAPDPFDMLFDGVEDSRSLLNLVNAVAADPDVRGVLLDMNSPGGMVTGGTDIAEAVAEMCKRKPVVAWTGGMMASLAYQIGSQAHEIVASRSATVGSIGTIITIADVSRALEQMGVKVEVITNKEAVFKGIGVPGTSLSDTHRDYLQSRSQAAFNEFAAMVKAKRPAVSSDSMRGQVFWGHEAKAAGLIDRIGSKSFAMDAVRKRVRGS